ncbi:hypothetical protein [Bacillus cereus]|uniref:hypothetical protein n=1 Tax=Bacillus cereus TaxID=1396 RepID=UPI0035CC3AE6
MQKIKIDKALIDSFRDTVTRYSFIESKYQNVNNKNKWNIICSSMDWITVAVNGLPYISLEDKPFRDDTVSINLMQYIMSIDLIYESIRQLYRVFLNHPSNYPLKEDSSIFQRAISDDDFFKHIRAVFGAHPVNLNSLDGANVSKGEKFYASWSAPDFIDGDFNVFLYSNNPENDKPFHFPIKMGLLNFYAEKRYELLEDLINIVNQESKEHIESNLNRPISKSDNPIKQLEILALENELRWGKGNGYYDSIWRIINFLKTNISAPDINQGFIQSYKNYLISKVEIIRERLQNMEFHKQEFIYAFYIFLHQKFKNQSYELRKVYEHIEGFDSSGYGIENIKILIAKEILPKNFLVFSSVEQLLILNAKLFSKLENLEKSEL